MSYSSVEFVVEPPEPTVSTCNCADALTQSEVTYPSSVVDFELRLSRFVSWVLQKSCSGQYPPQEALKMLDRAWQAQKMLWRLRQEKVFLAKGLEGDRDQCS